MLNNGAKGHSFVTEASSTSSMQNKPRFLSMKPRHHTNAFSSTAATGSEKAKDVVDINRADLWMRQACSSHRSLEVLEECRLARAGVAHHHQALAENGLISANRHAEGEVDGPRELLRLR